MKKFFPSYVRVPLLFVLFFLVVEYSIDSGNQPAFIKYPLVLVLYGFFLLALITIEVLISAINKILNQLLTPEQRAAQLAAENQSFTQASWYKNIMKVLTRSKSIEEEGEIDLQHDYDGIRELDNDLPPWWTALYYVTIIFAIVYLFRYHIFDGPTQAQEYTQEVAMANEAIAKYKLTAPDGTNVDNVKLLTDKADLDKGKAIFETNCVACHKSDGGGSIGPNLTDNYWILGGSVQNVFHTIMEGGRPGKGMIPWKDQIKPADIEKVTSYVLTLVGTNPPDAKAPEGELYVSETQTATQTSVNGTVAVDTMSMQEVIVTP